MRGEYAEAWAQKMVAGELPPRARRILLFHPFSLDYLGTTSACAENTYGYWMSFDQLWNYLRVRGEYGNPSWDCSGIWELPPRARRILVSPLTIAP